MNDRVKKAFRGAAAVLRFHSGNVRDENWPKMLKQQTNVFKLGLSISKRPQQQAPRVLKQAASKLAIGSKES